MGEENFQTRSPCYWPRAQISLEFVLLGVWERVTDGLLGRGLLYGESMADTPTRIHLFRHGEVAAPWPGLIYGQLDVPLSEVGMEQARWAAQSLDGVNLGAVISSGLSRAEASAAHLRADRPLHRRDEPDLLEIDRGSWAGMSPSEVDEIQAGGFLAWQASGGLLAPPGGETIQVMAARVAPKLHDLAEEFQGQTVAIVAHMWVVRIALCLGLKRPWQDAPKMRVGTGARTDFDWAPETGMLYRGAQAPQGSSIEISA